MKDGWAMMILSMFTSCPKHVIGFERLINGMNT